MNYEWEDLIDQSLTIGKNYVRGYSLPSMDSPVSFTFMKGDSIVLTYFTYYNGVCWVGYYNQFAQSYDWIPLQGNPGTEFLIPASTIGSVFQIDNILTHEEEEAQEEEENETVVDEVKSLAGTVILGIGAIVLINKLL